MAADWSTCGCRPGSYGASTRSAAPGAQHLLLTYREYLLTSTRNASDSAPASTMEPCALAAASRHAISVSASATSTALSARTCAQ